LNWDVELLGRYSKWEYWIERTYRLSEMTLETEETRQPRPYAAVRKLTSDQVQELIVLYESGATLNELAAKFEIQRQTVSAHLHRQGVKMRRQGLAGQQVIDSARLYKDGWSCARIARHFDVNHGTVWLALRANGVQMRDQHGRDR
jgi:hypothetical protein